MTAKRIIDVLVSAAVLLLLAPLLGMLALVILIAQGRPVLFRQERVGRHGRLFTMYKFRTMVVDAPDRLEEIAHANDRVGPLFKCADDPRVTVIGRILRRTSIDEIPQLCNVLIGNMSLVGPRPALAEERAQFPAELLEREDLPQGITGLWQLEGRNESDFAVYRDLDLDYVRTWTMRRDLSILVRTPFVVASHALRRAPELVEARGAEAGDVEPTPPGGDLAPSRAVFATDSVVRERSIAPQALGTTADRLAIARPRQRQLAEVAAAPAGDD